jgi:hypothetical protein
VEQAMSVRKLTASLLAALAVAGAANLATAQESKLADPFEFDPDFHWFEPVYDADLQDVTAKKRASTGWFATYDRIHLYGTGPETTEPGIDKNRLDGGWGYRYELGYMLPGEDHGWLFNWTRNKVGEYHIFRQERLNRFIDPEDGPSVTQPPFGDALLPEEGNNMGYNYRFYDIVDTQNHLEYDSYELNKTWRMDPLHYGGIIEPFVGVRWMRMTDANGFMDYQSTDENPPLIGPNFEDAELLTVTGATTENELIGPQLGFRFFRARERYVFSTDFRVFCGANFQQTFSQKLETLTIYDGAGQGSEVERIIRNSTEPVYSTNEEFYIGFDVRAELGYQLTKMIQVRGGFQLIDVAQGVWRGGDGSMVNGGDDDQNYLMVGITAGVSVNH